MHDAFEQDLHDVFFQEFAEPAWFDGFCVRGLFRATEQRLTDLDGQLAPVHLTTLRVPTSAVSDGGEWAGISVDAQVTVRGRTFRLRDRQLEQDGAVTVLLLA